MNRRRMLATVVLAIGAAASIATSQATWDLEEQETLPGTVLDAGAPLLGYRVRAELRGPVEGAYGTLRIALHPALVAGTAGPAWLTVTIQPDRDPEQVTEQTFRLGNEQSPPPWHLSTDLWTACESPCVESFTVWLELSGTDGADTALAIDGVITASVSHVGDAPPPGTVLALDVEPLEDAP